MSFLKLVQEMNNLEDYTIEKQISGALQKGQTEAYRSGTGTKKKQVRELIFSANREFLENTVEQLFEQVELNEEERDAICEPGNAAIRGRSGTGKTTCLIMNILLHMLREVDFANIETRVTSLNRESNRREQRETRGTKLTPESNAGDQAGNAKSQQEAHSPHNHFVFPRQPDLSVLQPSHRQGR